MPFDLESEIARRLNVPREAVRPVLDTVIERIRQQVSHYGYARLAGLGTFRGHNGDIAFEADPALSDEVNVRFAGLEDVRVGSGPEERPEDEEFADFPESGPEVEAEVDEELEDEWAEEETPDEYPREDDVLYGDSPGDDYGRSSEEEGSEDEIPPPMRSGEEAEKEPSSGIADDLDETFPWEEEDVEEEVELGHETPGVQWADEEDEFSEDIFEEESDEPWEEPTYEESAEETEDVEETDAWLSQRDEHHPLGPPPETPFEEADYSVLDEHRTSPPVPPEDDFSYDEDDVDFEEGDEDEAPSVAWSPFEEAEAEAEATRRTRHEGAERPTDGGPEGRSKREDEETHFDEDAAMASMAAGGTFDDEDDDELPRSKAPDRHARPHERIRQQPPRRRAAAESTGGGAAGVNRSAIWIGVGVIIIVAAAAVMFFLRSPQEPAEPTAAERTEAPVAADTSALAADTAATPAADTAAAAAPGATVPEEPESTPLRSADGIDRSAGGYTIIVYSETSPGNAEEVAERYREQGFRTSVLEYQEDGATRYRVGVGQFSTLDEAADVRNRLAGGELPDDAWVRRVR